MAKRNYLDDRKEPLNVHGMAVDITVDKARNGQYYASFRLCQEDGTQTPAKVWNVDRNDFALDPSKVYLFTGVWDEFDDRPQAVVKNWKASDLPASRFLVRSKQDPMTLANEVLAHVKAIEDSFYRTATLHVFEKIVGVEKFANAPAASGNHAAYVGGLAEHTLGVLETALAYLDSFVPAGQADRSLVVAGAALHDIGKVYSYEVSPGFPMTVEGKLMGHPFIGANLVVKGGLVLPEGRTLKLVHLILSHHGKLDFGSPVVPQTMEALVVSFADLAEAKLHGAVEAVEKAVDVWSERVGILDGVRLFLGRESKEE